ncbi:MAG: nickel pincer cofactor biosynthesis protein LarC [Peptococcaceae bacterium]|nr:nickel pincer cofactor biosynthesis protein LarC [Peptococcaceae bacterium]
MRILFYDCFAGISGDMNLGALLDLGVDPDKLRQGLSLLGLDEAYELRIERGVKQGIVGTQVVVSLTEAAQPERSLADIESLIGQSDLSEPVKVKSLTVFRALAEAEGKAHGCSGEAVHFHEVGAVDALVDVVGGVICIEELMPDALWVSEVELGGGFAECAHGRLPVPAPAVAELVRGFSVRRGGMPFEATTPTGAALLRGMGAQSRTGGAFVPERTGYGLGSRDAETPNALRVWLGAAADYETGIREAFVTETNIDDMNPEWFAFVEEKLFEAGASDVYRTPIVMKKGRMAALLSVLAPDAQTLQKVQDVLLTHTTTLGLRSYAVKKMAAPRRETLTATPFGLVRVKWSVRDNKVFGKPEYEDCRRIATERGLTLHEVYREIGCFSQLAGED